MKKHIILSFTLLVIGLSLVSCRSILADVTAYDTPNDNGSSITLEWKPLSEVVIEYLILRGTSLSELKQVGKVSADQNKYEDNKLVRGKDYYYEVQAKCKGDKIISLGKVGPLTPLAQWFNTSQTPTAIGIVVFSAILSIFIYLAKRGERLFIRHIPGIDAIDEAIGRATETGRPVLYVTGTGNIRNIATIASMNVLSRVARMSAEYDVPMIVPCSDPIVMNIEREIVYNAHISIGRPDTYRQENIFFVSEEQFAYAAAVDGIIVRERPGAIFYMGMFQAESLIFGEVGNSIGAIQIAGTDSTTQLPFFIASCDYTLMGEEFYAASAYLSNDPLLLGSLKGQDWGKVMVIFAIATSVIAQLLGLVDILNFFRI